MHLKFFLPFLLLLGTAAIAKDPWRKAGGADALLSAEQAFALMPVEAHPGRLMLRWQIAPGYYLYQHRFQVESLPPAAPLKLKFPPGQARHDEHFGDVITHGGAQALQLTLSVPVNQAPKRLRVQYQGCAEVGVCLPPQTRIVDVVSAQP